MGIFLIGGDYGQAQPSGGAGGPGCGMESWHAEIPERVTPSMDDGIHAGSEV